MANNQGYYNNPSAGVSINYRKNKLGISSSINTNDYTQRQYYILRNGNSTSNNQSEGGMSILTRELVVILILIML